MRSHAFGALRPRCLGVLLLSLLLLLPFPAAVRAAGDNEATTPDCVRTGLEPQPMTVQLRLVNRQVAATLHSPPGALPTVGCRGTLQFPIPEDHRPRYAVWRKEPRTSMWHCRAPDRSGNGGEPPTKPSTSVPVANGCQDQSTCWVGKHRASQAGKDRNSWDQWRGVQAW